MRRAAPLARLLAFCFVLIAPISAQQRSSAPDLTGFDQWVTSVMAEWKVPGVAVGAVKDGKVVFMKGYGLRDVEAKLPVTPQTVMAIGSNSKSFTALLMGMLADEKKLDWDTPVRNYLPDFRLYDEIATRELTPKDLVTHRSGLPRHDNLWYGRPFTREQLFQRLRYLEPSASIRTRYQYQNLMFLAAGVLTERLTGRTWEQQLQERIFTPLGMTRSSPSANDLPRAGDFSHPYLMRNDSVVRVPVRNIDAVGPAGSINSSVEDMLKYIQFRIDQGTVGGKRLVSEAQERLMQTPHMVSGGGFDYPELGLGNYGLGVGVSTYRGHKLVVHGGGIDGFISSMSWLPDQKMGIMVLTNFSGDNPVPVMVMRTLYDRLLGAPKVDWAARVRTASAEDRARAAKREAERKSERKTGTSPSHPINAYAGSYEHPGYGTLVVTVDGGKLSAMLDPHRVALEHFHYDVWEINDPGNIVPFGGRLRFLTNAKGDIDQVAFPLEPNVSDIIFKRK
ncbi:MAG: serine hydrolase [Gemmatimonadales bacterium]